MSTAIKKVEVYGSELRIGEMKFKYEGGGFQEHGSLLPLNAFTPLTELPAERPLTVDGQGLNIAFNGSQATVCMDLPRNWDNKYSPAALNLLTEKFEEAVIGRNPYGDSEVHDVAEKSLHLWFSFGEETEVWQAIKSIVTTVEEACERAHDLAKAEFV